MSKTVGVTENAMRHTHTHTLKAQKIRDLAIYSCLETLEAPLEHIQDLQEGGIESIQEMSVRGLHLAS